MKHLKLRLILLVLLVCLAFASAAFALKPLIDGAEKSIEVKQAVEEYRETISEIREEAEKAEENLSHTPNSTRICSSITVSSIFSSRTSSTARVPTSCHSSS